MQQRTTPIRTIGGIRIEDAQLRPKEQSILACLVAARRTPVSALRIIELCWGGVDDRLVNSLKTHMSRLRQQLTTAHIEFHGTGYALDAADAAVDVWQFEALAATRHDDQWRRATAIENALALWPSELTPFGTESNDLVDPYIARLLSLRERVVLELADLDTQRNAHSSTLDELMSLAAAMPDRADVVSRLAAQLWLRGRHVEALDAINHLRTALDARGLELDPQVRSLEGDILLHRGRVANHGGARSTIPRAPTNFVGRDAEVAELIERAEIGGHLSITGVGGIGKTRLACELAHALQQRGQRVAYVNLTTWRDDPLPPVAAAMRVNLGSSPDRQLLMASIRSTTDVLLVDNCEHMSRAAGALVDEMIAACPKLLVITTSRKWLGNAAETLYPLTTLSDEAALRLLSDRLPLKRGATIALDPTIGDLLRHLSGIPLALELAAGPLATITLPEFLRAVQAAYEPSRHGADTADDLSLRATIQRSLDDLRTPDREFLQAIAVMRSVFGTHAAAAVAGVTTKSAAATLRTLVAASLVTVRHANGASWFHLLEPIRLAVLASPDADVKAAAARHAAHHLAESARCADLLFGPDERDASSILSEQLGGFRAAFEWALDHDDAALGAELAANMSQFAWAHLRHDVLAWNETVLTRWGSTLDAGRLAKTYAAAGASAWVRTDVDLAIEHSRASLQHAAVAGLRAPLVAHNTLLATYGLTCPQHEADQLVMSLFAEADASGKAFWMVNTAVITAMGAASRGFRDITEALSNTAAKHATQADCPSAYSWASFAAGIAVLPTAPANSVISFDVAEQLAESVGNEWFRMMATTMKAVAVHQCGDPRSALAIHATVLDQWIATRFVPQVGQCLADIALCLLDLDAIDEARLSLATALAITNRLPLYEGDDAIIQAAARQLGLTHHQAPAPVERLVSTAQRIGQFVHSLPGVATQQ